MLRRYTILPILVALSLIAAACGSSGSVPNTGATSAPGYSRGSNSGSYGYGGSSSATSAPAATSMPAPTMAPAATSMPAPTQASASSGGGGGYGNGYGGSSSATQAPSSAAAQVGVSQNAQLGSFLVDGKGMTLYVFMKDTGPTSTCYGKCASFWPPLLTSGAAVAGSGVDSSKLGTTTRTDGTTQVTYNGHPLYHFSQDQNPGDTNGQKIQGIWFVVSPSGDPVQK